MMMAIMLLLLLMRWRKGRRGKGRRSRLACRKINYTRSTWKCVEISWGAGLRGGVVRGQGERLLSVTSFSAIGITNQQHKQALQIAAVTVNKGRGGGELVSPEESQTKDQKNWRRKELQQWGMLLMQHFTCSLAGREPDTEHTGWHRVTRLVSTPCGAEWWLKLIPLRNRIWIQFGSFLRLRQWRHKENLQHKAKLTQLKCDVQYQV